MPPQTSDIFCNKNIWKQSDKVDWNTLDVLLVTSPWHVSVARWLLQSHHRPPSSSRRHLLFSSMIQTSLKLWGHPASWPSRIMLSSKDSLLKMIHRFNFLTQPTHWFYVAILLRAPNWICMDCSFKKPFRESGGQTCVGGGVWSWWVGLGIHFLLLSLCSLLLRPFCDC